MRILFCPLASHGFVYPMLGMALEARRRKHSVAFATDVTFTDAIAAQGFERIPRSACKDGRSFRASHWPEARWAAVQVKHTEHAVESFQPDLLVGLPLTLGPLIAAERNHLPIALMGFCTYLWPTGQRGLERPEGPIEERLSWRLHDWTRLFNEARSLFRLPAVTADPEGSATLGDRFLLRNVPRCIADAASLPEKVDLVGPCLWEPEERDEELDSWLEAAVDSGEPIVYIQHGRYFDGPHFWPTAKAALARRNYRVAISTARMDCAVGSLPENFLARPFLPQSRILEHADLIITAGNTTAALGAITAGVPALLVPGGGEQPDVAEHCERLGMARVLSPSDSLDAGRFLMEIDTVIGDPSYLENVRIAQQAFARRSGFQSAVDALEKALCS